MFENIEQVRERWTQDLTLILTTLEDMAIERDWCGEWGRLVVAANNRVTVKFPTRQIVFKGHTEVPETNWCLIPTDFVAYRAVVIPDEILEVQSKPVVIPESFNVEELLRVWQRDIETVADVFGAGAVNNSKLDDWDELLNGVNHRLHFPLPEPEDREVTYTITFTYSGRMNVPWNTQHHNVQEAIAEDLDIQMDDLEQEGIDWVWES